MLLVSCVWAEEPQQPPALFEDATQAVGLSGVESSRVSFVDLNADGRPDALINYAQIFLNDGGKRFTRYSGDTAFLPEGARAFNVAVPGDVNNDGWPDLYLGRSTDLSNEKFTDDGLRSELWLADGHGGFKRREKAGLTSDAETTIAACFVDYDRDGNLDLFVGNAYTAYGQSYEAFPDRLYRGHGDGTFTDVTEAAGLLGIAEAAKRESRKPTYGVTHADWNNDGFEDLLVATYGRQWNRLWRNNGDGTFTDVAAEVGFDGDEDRSGEYPAVVEREKEEPFRANGNTFDCAVADFDNDGDLDCFLAEITHWWAGSSSDRSMLLVNQGPDSGFVFRREPERIVRTHGGERWNQGDLSAGWLDVENDGYLDLLIASSDYPDDQLLRLYHQEPDGRFVEWTDRLGFHWRNASQLSLADYDGDGATDILLGTNNMRLTPEQRAEHGLSVGLFRNVAAARAKNHFMTVRLQGQTVGARVVVASGTHRQLRIVQGGLGHAGHYDDPECRFGLGAATAADTVEVYWPDAQRTVQRFEKVAADHHYRLSRGGTLDPLP